MTADRDDGIVLAYQESRPLYENFANKLALVITDLLSNAGIRTDAVQQRAKTVASLRQKQAKRENPYAAPEDIPDLAGLRVIVYHHDDVDRVVEAIRSEFEIDGEASGDKAASLAPHEFGYLSVHLVIRLPSRRRILSEWKDMADLHAEVQVRTVLQHAWASISHSFQYKRQDEVPDVLRRRLNRLAALLELADQEFDTLTEEHNQLQSSANPKAESDLMILRRVLGKSPRSFEWIRNHTPLRYSDEEFSELIQEHPSKFEFVHIVLRDSTGERVKPGKPGMRLRGTFNGTTGSSSLRPE